MSGTIGQLHPCRKKPALQLHVDTFKIAPQVTIQFMASTLHKIMINLRFHLAPHGVLQKVEELAVPIIHHKRHPAEQPLA
eukprot:281108-Pelagomonas_calceolata.AAC.8